MKYVNMNVHAGQLFADPQVTNASGLATLMPGNPNFQPALGQQMLLGAPKSLTRKEAGAPGGQGGRKPPAGKVKSVVAGSHPPGNLSGTIPVCLFQSIVIG